MTKIAFIDVDETLVDNKTSGYNKDLIDFLSEGSFEQVYLVTGRNTNDFWQFVLQMGKKPEGWRNQLLCNVVEHLRSRGIKIAGVSTPYDHYLFKLSSDCIDVESDCDLFKITKAGDAAELFYMPFERKIECFDDAIITQSLLVDTFIDLTGGNRYVAFPDGEADQCLIDALPMYLAMTSDTEKKGQLSFLLERVLSELAGDLDVFFFDDKPENLMSAEAVFADHERIKSYHAIVVEKVLGYAVPSEISRGITTSFGLK